MVENWTHELQRLRGCVNNLISLMVIPAFRNVLDPPQIVNGLLETLVPMLRLDFAYARVTASPLGLPIEVLRVASRLTPSGGADVVGRALDQWLTQDKPTAHCVIPNPIGSGNVSIAAFWLRVERGAGMVVTGSQRAGYPTDAETILVRVAVNQAVIEFQRAQILAQHQEAERSLRNAHDLLEAKVQERTAELASLAEKLKSEITQRGRTEVELKRLASIVEKSGDFMGIADLTLQVVFVNEAGLRLVGLDSSPHFRDTNVRDYFFPQDHAFLTTEILRTAIEAQSWAGEFRLRHFKTGNAIPVLMNLFRIDDPESGQPMNLATVTRDITDRKRAEEELSRLSGQLLRLQDEERSRIARDLHDLTGQDLVALATMIGQLRELLPSRASKSRRLLSDCKALADRCIRDVRTLSYVLHSPVLEQAGLGDAIRDYVKGFSKRSGIRVKLEVAPGIRRMSRDIELALFRVVQESLTNIQRHSGNHNARIRLERNSHLTLEISDSRGGTGANLTKRPLESPFQYGVGIPSMQERVKSIGGQMEIHRTQEGTLVRVTMPLGGTRERSTDPVG